MKIVVLDGYTLNPGDLLWTELESLGRCEIHDRTPAELILERSAGASAILTNKTPLTANSIAALPELRYIGVLATGYNVIDIAAARQRGIIVTNIPGYGTESVAQATFALILELTHHAGEHSQSVHQGRWSASKDFCYWDHPLVELSGLTIGIIGLGAIGTCVARMARGFGMRMIGYSRSGSRDSGVETASVEEIFRNSDILSLHCPLTPETANLINPARISRMKPTAFLINTSRGGLIDEPALAKALNDGRLAGAGLDVLSIEPPPATNPLLHAKNCLITPHLAWATRAARHRLMHQAVANLRSFLAGEPVNVVS